jgi:hypothetical protein
MNSPVRRRLGERKGEVQVAISGIVLRKVSQPSPVDARLIDRKSN